MLWIFNQTSQSALWLGLWFELCAFTSIETAIPITNRICALRGNFCSYCANWPTHGFSANHLNESRSERALRSQVLRIRLSIKQITIQNVLRVSKAWFERALCSQRVTSGFKSGKGQNHDPKQLLERDSLLCEQAQYYNDRNIFQDPPPPGSCFVGLYKKVAHVNTISMMSCIMFHTKCFILPLNHADETIL